VHVYQMGKKVPDVRNLLLRQLPDNVLDAILPQMELVELKQGDVLFEVAQRFRHIHFFEGGMSSEIAVNPDGKSIEVGCVGFEGFSGVPAALGVDSSEHRAFMQAPAQAYRMRTEAFQEAMETHRPLARLLLRYVHVFLMQAAATALNNGRYSVDRRLARWLLMSQTGWEKNCH
jgi:CRP-like cAMP-binding protein